MDVFYIFYTEYYKIQTKNWDLTDLRTFGNKSVDFMIVDKKTKTKYFYFIF